MDPPPEAARYRCVDPARGRSPPAAVGEVLPRRVDRFADRDVGSGVPPVVGREPFQRNRQGVGAGQPDQAAKPGPGGLATAAIVSLRSSVFTTACLAAWPLVSKDGLHHRVRLRFRSLGKRRQGAMTLLPVSLVCLLVALHLSQPKGQPESPPAARLGSGLPFVLLAIFLFLFNPVLFGDQLAVGGIFGGLVHDLGQEL